MTTSSVFVALCAVLCCTACSTANADPARALYIDDDLFSGMAADADYTGGVAVTLADDSANGRYELEVGAAAFTPADTASSDVVRGDRPYANLVYASAALIQAEAGRSAVTALTVGILGLAIVPTAQRRIHSVMGSDQPQGWRHQISEGGEPTLRLTHEQIWTGPALDLAGGRMQWLGRVGAGLGFVTDISGGAGVRFGRFSDSRWRIHTSPLGLSDRAASDHVEPGDRFVYATVSARVPLYNAFLQGQFRDSDFTVPASERRDFIPGASLGIVLGLQKRRALHYFLRAQRSDVRLAKRSDSIVYAGLSLAW